ncbi:hypothetical protein B296_00043952 [Ensete ventricosum]|uniref:Uncharacterized protein n=1 Tax=Ensete ventricosum TaxID=4639 RepID=A0A426Z012_ENSVE|nr:hypothetical protein B296_00043952 [Ensete ventricosum]
MIQIFTRCQGDHCVVNLGEGLTTVDFGGGDAATTGVISRSERQREKRCDRLTTRKNLLRPLCRALRDDERWPV